MSWEAAAARARGLASRLLAPAVLAELERSGELEPVRRAVAGRGFPLATPADAAAIEEAVRLGAGAELRVLSRWLDAAQREALQPWFAAEDRRSLRRILRGLAAGVPPAGRASGTLPTPTLPARALDELARRSNPAAVAALLCLWGNPFGAALAAETAAGEPRLLRLELALDRALAAQLRTASRAADRSLRRLAVRWIDGLDAAIALLLAGGERELPPEECFLAGGKVLDRESFLAAAAAPGTAAAARLLAPRFGGAVGRALRRPESAAAWLEAALLVDALAEQRALARRLPLSAAPVAWYLLALTHEAAVLRRAAWRATLGVGAAEATALEVAA